MTEQTDAARRLIAQEDARRNPVKTETRIPAGDFLAAEISNRR